MSAEPDLSAQRAAPTTRRVVTGHDAAGKAIVRVDAPAANVRYREASGVYSTLLWMTDTAPADNGGDADAAARPTGVAPPPNGSIFRIVDFPPASLTPAAASNAAVLAEMGLSAESGGAARSAFMHRTRSVDYALVLTGEIVMLLDETEVTLKAGDVLVQRGTNHAWENRSADWCRVAFVLIDALPAGPDAAAAGA